MRQFLAAALVAISFFQTSAAVAGDHPVVVELYTSQGCSSCPPADALLTKLAGRDDVIALALHVDYWDYIGWKDNLANPAFTARQKSYARAGGHRSVYTPQMIVGGVDHVIGNKPMELADAINAHRAIAPQADLVLQKNGNRLEIEANWLSSKAAKTQMVLQLVRYDERQQVKIGRGENAGKTIDYSNIVTHWEPIGTWDGRGKKNVTVDMGSSKGPIAVILQFDGYGPVVAAAQLK